MSKLWYFTTRLITALAALMCADVIADTTTAAEPTSILAGMGLVIIVDLLIASNSRPARPRPIRTSSDEAPSTEDIVERHQRAQIHALLQSFEDPTDA